MLFQFEGRMAALCAAVLTLAGHAGADELRIGFVTDHSGPGALQTVHQRNGWLLGLAHEGWAKDGDKVRGVSLRMFFSDDQGKPDIGLREVNKLLLNEKVAAYDGARFVAAGLEAVSGKLDDRVALAKAMRQAKFPSPRGSFAYNVNGFSIQNFYKREVVRGADGKPLIATRGLAVREPRDPFYEECPAERRL